MLLPLAASVDCLTGAIAEGVPVEELMRAAEPARHKVLILDACRHNPLVQSCHNLEGKKLSFTRIEAGAMQGLLIVTSTQFGQQALDGFRGAHSPFAASLMAALEANPNVYFEQVMNEAANISRAGPRALLRAGTWPLRQYRVHECGSTHPWVLLQPHRARRPVQSGGYLRA
jgi:hypothetical protein